MNNEKDHGNEGFTLIELLVVILIIAILAAVGIVALLGAIRSGQDSAAKQTLTNASKEVRNLEIDSPDSSGGIISSMQEKLQEISPDFTWQTTEITGDPTNVISIGSVGPEIDGGIIFGARSKSGKCLYLYAKPLSSASFPGMPEKSTLKLISTESFDVCPLIPVPDQTTPLDPDAFKFF
jgi:prepilin-type N-terminal cleavage/methylation domain-containing protein